MRPGSFPAVLGLALLVSAVLGGIAALAIGSGAGWISKDPKTVVVNARSAPSPVALPAAVASRATPIPGNGFDPARIYAGRSAGVVTVYTFFGNPDDQA